MSAWSFFKLGFSHIAFLNVFSHLLFIIALCGIYTFRSWRMVSWFCVAFFTGYLLAFIPITLDIFSLPQRLLDFLLPFTIFFVAITNFFLKKNAFLNRYPSQNYRYFVAFFAGMIHGSAFPEALKPLLTADSLLYQIIAYNGGLIIALILIILFLLLVTFILTYLLRVPLREWNLILSGACAGIAVYQLINQILFIQLWR